MNIHNSPGGAMRRCRAKCINECAASRGVMHQGRRKRMHQHGPACCYAQPLGQPAGFSKCPHQLLQGYLWGYVDERAARHRRAMPRYRSGCRCAAARKRKWRVNRPAAPAPGCAAAARSIRRPCPAEAVSVRAYRGARDRCGPFPRPAMPARCARTARGSCRYASPGCPAGPEP